MLKLLLFIFGRLLKHAKITNIEISFKHSRLFRIIYAGFLVIRICLLTHISLYDASSVIYSLYGGISVKKPPIFYIILSSGVDITSSVCPRLSFFLFQKLRVNIYLKAAKSFYTRLKRQPCSVYVNKCVWLKIENKL